jgi:hypothetical protein
MLSSATRRLRGHFRVCLKRYTREYNESNILGLSARSYIIDKYGALCLLKSKN